MAKQKKIDLPVHQVRQVLEPGPVVIVSSFHQGKRNLMTMGWHTVMEFSPSLVGCMISGANHSHQLIRDSGECVLNVPDFSLLDTVVGIGNISGIRVDKFERFGLTPGRADIVKAPLVRECFAHMECRLHDDTMVDSYNFFIFEVVKAHIISDALPPTVHYKGEGQFMISGATVDKSSLFRKDML